MVILLVILTIGLGLGLEAIRRARKPGGSEQLPEASRVRSPATVIDRYFHPGYSWLELAGRDLVTVGADDIVPGLLGRIEKIEIVPGGTQVQQGETLAILRRKGRFLPVAAPISGILAEVNPRLTEHPSLLNDSPYEKGWIARILPTRLRIELGNLFGGASADRWRDGIRMEIGRRFSPQCGPVLQDGGRWSEDPAAMLSDPQWEELVQALFPLSLRARGLRLSSTRK